MSAIAKGKKSHGKGQKKLENGVVVRGRGKRVKDWEWSGWSSCPFIRDTGQTH